MVHEESDKTWSISVKTVGAECMQTNNDFTVTVSPEDDLAALHSKIQDVTGWTASQQRLIYRGRLMNEETLRMKDIAGLSDGQTIHLVKKKDAREEHSGIRTNSPREHPEDSASPSSPSFLTSLLGMNDDSSSSRGGNNSWRRSRRRLAYRLTAEDVVVRDPGPMEAVRQGLMTLHTILPHAESPTESPLDFNRQFYVGQWIDCRDTVNQWLEATVIDIVEPSELLASRESPLRPRVASSTSHPVLDPAVPAGDLEGRMRLLLEPCELGHPDEESGEWAGFRQRANNHGIQLLLLHYNGWPHRWDEWIRSDSERIRPFRVRTRHPSVSDYASPTPQSIYHESPATFIRNEDDAQDRLALLPELSRIMNTVNDLVSRASQQIPPPPETTDVERVSERLPWSSRNISLAASEDKDDEFRYNDNGAHHHHPLNRHELQSLAAVLDRLGRTLIDASPHIAALAGNIEEENTNTESSAEVVEHPTSLGGLLSLLRDRRRNATNNSTPSDAVSASVTSSERTAASETDGPLDPDFVDFATGAVNTTRGEVRTGPRSRLAQTDDLSALLGAYLAAASLGGLAGSNGDGENGGGLERLLRNNGGGIDIHIHAIVTPPANVGNNDGTIGIATFGGGGGGATLATTSPVGGGLFSFDRDRSARSTSFAPLTPLARQNDDDDDGIFSDLYSENPDPVDPTGRPEALSENPRPPSPVARTPSPPDLPRRHSSFSSPSQSTRRLNNNNNSRRSDSDSNRRAGMFSRLFRRTSADH